MVCVYSQYNHSLTKLYEPIQMGCVFFYKIVFVMNAQRDRYHSNDGNIQRSRVQMMDVLFDPPAKTHINIISFCIGTSWEIGQ